MNFPLSDYAKALESHVLKRYHEKISAVGIDPFLVPEKYFNPECLPPVESIDLVSFLVLETSYYTQNQFKAFKTLQHYNQMVSGFIKSVEGHLISGNYIVIGKVRHSQKMNDPCVPLWIIANREGAILSAHCRGGMAGLGECCSHVASVLFYLEIFNRIRGKISCTQMKSSWLLPSFVKDISFAEVRNINFKSAKKLKNDLDQTVDNLDATHAFEPLQFTPKAESNTLAPDASELNDLFARLSLCKNKPVVLSIIHPYSKMFVPRSSNIQVIPDLFDKKYLDMEYHELLKACSEIKLEISKEDLQIIEEETRNQASGSQFFRYRAGRIGASVSKQACHTNPAQPSQSLIKRICYPNIFKFSTAATEHGCKHESLAIKTYEDIMKLKHINFRVEQCGLFVHAQYPWIHATPDFRCCCDCCGSGCGEVKCPFCLKVDDFASYTLKKGSCLLSEEDKFVLRRDHNYYYQVQQQLFTINRSYNDFIVCRVSNGKVELVSERIYPDIKHWNSVLPTLTHFWWYCLLPEILGRWYTQKRDLKLNSVDPKGICFCCTSTPGSSVVSCSNRSCPISEFHLTCLKIANIPPNWLCILCQTSSSGIRKRDKSSKVKQGNIVPEALKQKNICICKQRAMKTDKLLECHGDSCQNGKYFHLQCINYKRMPNNASTWQCSHCKSKPKQSEKTHSLAERYPTCGEVTFTGLSRGDGTTSSNFPSKQIEPKSSSQGSNHSTSDIILTGTSTGNTERFAKLCDLTEQHFQLVLSPNGWLDCDIIHASHVLLRDIDPTMEGLQRPTLGPCRNFRTVTGQFIQILHTGHQHWVCVSTVGSDDGMVDLYDSMFHNVIENEVEEQVKNLVGSANFSGIKVVAVQQQRNGSDCGVFCIAFATCLIHGILPQTVQFVDATGMRTHLYDCFRKKQT